MEEGDEGGEEIEDRTALNTVPTERAPLGRSQFVALLAAAGIALIRNGLWGTPNLAFFVAITEDVGTNPFPPGFSGDYLLTNLTGPLVARLVGATAPHHYALVHLGVLLIGIGGVLAAVQRRWGSAASVSVAMALAVAPVTTTSLQWLGQPDAFTLPLALALVIIRPRTVVVAAAMVLGATHAEQGVFIAMTAAVARVVLDDASPSWRAVARQAAAPLAGVVTGGGAVRLWYVWRDVEIRGDRASFLELGASQLWAHHTRAGLWLPVALWGLLWIPIAWAIRWWLNGRHDPEMADLRRRWSWIGGAALSAVIPVTVTLDQTRVFGLLTAPLLLAAAVSCTRHRPAPKPGLTGALLVAAVIVPGSFTAGELYGRWNLPEREFVTFLRDGSHPGELTPWLLGPFDFEVPVPER